MDINTAIHTVIEQSKLERSPHTAHSYRTALIAFTKYLSSKGLLPTDDVNRIEVGLFIFFPAYLLENKYSKSTVSVYMSGADYFMDWLVIQDILEPSYREELRYKKARSSAMKRREAKLPRHPKPGQAESLIEAAYRLPWESPRKERDIAIVSFLYSSGCRNAEICGLKIKDLDLSDRSGIVTGKGSKQRRVFFDHRTLASLKSYWLARGHQTQDDPVFARHDDGAGDKIKPLTTATVRNIISDICMLAGIESGKFTPHYFRHAYAMKMLKETGNLALVQDLLGHASPMATRVYAKIEADELRMAHHNVYK